MLKRHGPIYIPFASHPIVKSVAVETGLCVQPINLSTDSLQIDISSQLSVRAGYFCHASIVSQVFACGNEPPGDAPIVPRPDGPVSGPCRAFFCLI